MQMFAGRTWISNSPVRLQQLAQRDVYERVDHSQTGEPVQSARVYIGTSGWHYKHWLGTFYPEKTPASKMLAFYITKFDTVELNNSFYHLPSKVSMNAWHDNTPQNFLFAVKGSRFLTHMKKLKDARQGLERFLDAAEELKEKLGPILFQLPPNWEVNIERLEEFLNILPTYHRYAFEFRNPTWETEEIHNLLSREECGLLHLRSGRLSVASPDNNRLLIHTTPRTRRQVSRHLFGCGALDLGRQSSWNGAIR